MNETFKIENDMQAEWALGKIAEAKATQQKWADFYNQKLDAVKAETENTITYMTMLLQEYFNSQEHRVTKTGIRKYALPSGELQLKPGGLDYEKDEAALLGWCEKHHPEMVKITRKPSWADIKAYIKETGDMPDGVTPYETAAAFVIKEAK